MSMEVAIERLRRKREEATEEEVVGKMERDISDMCFRI